ncbi:flavodoxin family protein, partial [Desulfovibrio sp. OttesenSCG-928-C06]|nr:flavodoxin family protein [Desulfovibrio sp. OttesenSCG-928-C06]
MARVLIVNSSFRKNSNSSALGQKVAAGAEKAGHQVKILNIGRMHIEPCRGCGGCTRSGGDFCVLRDDMTALYKDVYEAEVLVYVSPIYWFNLGGQIKQFIDRCFAVAMKPKEEAQGDAVPFGKKKLAAVFAYEGDDPFESGAINAIRSLQDTCSYAGATWGGVYYATANAEG